MTPDEYHVLIEGTDAEAGILGKVELIHGRVAIQRARPRLVVCEHVHEGRGASGFGSYNDWTLVANVCLLNWHYQPCYEPMQFFMPQRPRPTELLSSRG